MGKMTDIIGKAGGKDGFRKSVEDKGKRKADYAKRVYGQTEEEKEEIKDMEQAEKERVMDERRGKHAKAESEHQMAAGARRVYLETHTKQNRDNYNDLKNKKRQIEKALKTETDPQEIALLKKDLERNTERMKNYRDWETDRKSTRLNSSH